MTSVSCCLVGLLASLSPLWFRVGLSGDTEPAFLSLFVRHRSSPYYTHANVTGAGLRTGAVPQGGAKARLQPRRYTPWMDLTAIFQDGSKPSRERIGARLIRQWDVPLTNAAFVIELSTDRTNLLKRLLRKGPGCGLCFAADQQEDGTWRIVQDAEGAKESRRIVEAFPPCQGRAPGLFPVSTGCALSTAVTMPSVIADERAALRQLGLNGLKGLDLAFPFCREFTFDLGRMPHIDAVKARQRARAWADALPRGPTSTKTILVNVGDETHVGPEHMTNCTVCATRVPGGPTLDKADGRRYYETMRTLADVTTEGLRTMTEALGEVRPGLPVSVNNGIGLLFVGNMAASGVDWFTVYGTGALTYGWGEDWANFGRTKQINSLYWDAMRAACRTRDIPFGFYDILAHNGWEIRAKAYSSIGRGARSLHFFNYGPWYAVASDSQSARPEVLEAIRDVTHSIGPVEESVLAARCARGDAAILLGMTGDIWQAGEDNEYGMERAAISLLLRHCGMRTDVLGEDQVADSLENYPLLFVLDRNVRRDVAANIIKWVEKGGRLYLGPNAMSADEANAPLDLGFSRGTYAKVEKVGRPKFELIARREQDRFKGMRVIVGLSRPYFTEVARGRGHILLSGIFPGLDYWGSATEERDCWGMLDYPEAHRAFFREHVLKGVRVRTETSDPRVEASLLEGPKGQVLVLSNWTGKETDVTYVVRDVKGNVTGRGHVKLGAGGFVTLNQHEGE